MRCKSDTKVAKPIAVSVPRAALDSSTPLLSPAVSSGVVVHGPEQASQSRTTPHNFAHIPLFPPGRSSMPIQAKLSMGLPGDKYEQEADRIADKVIGMRPSPVNMHAGGGPQQPQLQQMPWQQSAPLAITPWVQRQTIETEEEEEETPVQSTVQAKTAIQRQEENEEQEEEPVVQAKPFVESQAEDEKEERELEIQSKTIPGRRPTVSTGVASSISAMQGGGQALSPETRGFMEPRFAHDFSRVRIHADSHAANTSRQINARAFTVGNDIAFGAGQYQPHTSGGKKLLAHELTHTIQQTGMVQRQGAKSPKPKNRYEDCTSAQKTAIGTAFTNALGYVNNAVSALNTAYSNHPKITPRVKTMLNQNFHTTKKKDISKILSKFRDIQSAMSRGINFECETDCDKGVGGYVWKFLFWEVGDVHICFKLFNALTPLQQEEVIIHEIAHRHAGVGDEAYQWQPKYKSLSAKDAMDNADSYAVFARRL